MDAEGCIVAELECGEETGVGAQLLLLRVWVGRWREKCGVRGGGKEMRSEGGGGGGRGDGE